MKMLITALLKKVLLLNTIILLLLLIMINVVLRCEQYDFYNQKVHVLSWLALRKFVYCSRCSSTFSTMFLSFYYLLV